MKTIGLLGRHVLRGAHHRLPRLRDRGALAVAHRSGVTKSKINSSSFKTSGV